MFIDWAPIWLRDAAPPEPLPAFCARGPRAVYRLARMQGWSKGEAGNLTAWCAHLPLSFGETPLRPWTLRTVQDMLFLRSMRRRWPG